VPSPEAVFRDLDIDPADAAEPHQRVAAYALVTSTRGVLLTQFTGLTNVEGEWGLPGGGLDPGESPVEGVHREVWEETGQRVRLGELVAVQSSHWVGRAPSGVVEDFHAVRIVYAATCASPGDPVVHDVGGTTADARWFAPHELGSLPLTRSTRRLEALQALARRDYDAP
jgi:ADP-ribose pyrophosphatase YjhB (NUDIX family)